MKYMAGGENDISITGVPMIPAPWLGLLAKPESEQPPLD
jgi:hypothetical protein